MILSSCRCLAPYHSRRRAAADATVALDGRRTRQDPTGTGSLRARFERDMVRRFTKVKRLIRRAIVELDVLGARGNLAAQIQSHVIAASVLRRMPLMSSAKDAAPQPQTREFAFERPADKVQGFMSWLRSAARSEILQTETGTPLRSAANVSWMNTYIDSAYQSGLKDAKSLTNEGLRVGAGNFNSPVHADRVALIYTRAYRDLEGITDEMDKQISRVLAQAMAEGRGIGPASFQGAYDLAQELADRVDSIGITRARTLARTEVIGAHAEAALNLYEEVGLEDVTADVEFATAEDTSVCPECADMRGDVYTIEDARGVIPVHPNCRCAWIPVVQDAGGAA